MKRYLIYPILIFILFSLMFVSSCRDMPESRNESSSNPSDSRTSSFWANDVSEINSLTETDENVFYISKNGIVKYDKLKNTDKILVEGQSVNSFRISNGLIYFCENNDTIYSVDMNGEDRVKVVELKQVEDLLIEKSFTFFEVYEKNIYIKSSGTSMIRFNLSTQKTENFVDDVAEYAFLGNSFFYIDHAEKTFSIFQKDLNTGKVVLLRGDGKSKGQVSPQQAYKYEWYDNVIAVNDRLYYTMRGPAKLFRLEQAGKDTLIEGFTNIEDANYLTITASGNNLYYILESGSLEGHLFKYDTLSGEKKDLITLNNVNYSFGIKVINNCVFYYSANDNSLTYSPI